MQVKVPTTKFNREDYPMFKKIAAIAVAMMISSAGAAFADSHEKEITMKEIQERRTEIVLANLPLDEAEKAKFDPAYAAYRTEVVKLNERLINLVQTFADEFESASDERIETIMREGVEARKNHLDTFEAAIGIRKTFRLYQIENKLDSIISIQLAAAVPLIPAD
jgi:hypothetical protein